MSRCSNAFAAAAKAVRCRRKPAFLTPARVFEDGNPLCTSFVQTPLSFVVSRPKELVPYVFNIFRKSVGGAESEFEIFAQKSGLLSGPDYWQMIVFCFRFYFSWALTAREASAALARVADPTSQKSEVSTVLPCQVCFFAGNSFDFLSVTADLDSFGFARGVLSYFSSSCDLLSMR